MRSEVRIDSGATEPPGVGEDIRTFIPRSDGYVFPNTCARVGCRTRETCKRRAWARMSGGDGVGNPLSDIIIQTSSVVGCSITWQGAVRVRRTRTGTRRNEIGGVRCVPALHENVFIRVTLCPGAIVWTRGFVDMSVISRNQDDLTPRWRDGTERAI